MENIKRHDKWNCYYTLKSDRPYDYEVLTSMDKEIAVYNEYSNQVIVFGNMNRTTKRHLAWFVTELKETYKKEPVVKRLSVKNRNKLFRIHDEDYMGDDYASFYNLNLYSLTQAIEKGYFEKDEAQNASPTVSEFLEFAEKNKKIGRCTFSGYLIYPPRRDCRATIDSIQVYSPDKNFKNQFRQFCKTADIIEIKEEAWHYYAWWD